MDNENEVREVVLRWLRKNQHSVGGMAESIRCVDDAGTLVVDYEDDLEEINEFVQEILDVVPFERFS